MHDPNKIPSSGTQKDVYIHALESRVRYLETLLEERDVQTITDTGTAPTIPPQDADAYRALVDQSLIGMTIVQNDCIMFCNQAFADMIGYTIDELLKLDEEAVLNLNHADEHPTIVKRHLARLRGESVTDRFVQRMVRKDGSTCWVEVHATRIIYMGQPAVHAAFADITERKQTEDAYHAITQHEAIGVNITQDEQLVFCNQAFADMIGYELDALLKRKGSTLWDLVHPDDKQLIARRHQRRLAGDTDNYRYDIRVIHRDGSIRWLEIYAIGIMYQGRPAVQSTYIDITERKHAEDALKQSERQFRSLAENSPDFISRSTPDGRYTYVNQAIVDSMGRPREAIFGNTAHENGMDDDIWAMTQEKYSTVMTTGEPLAYEYDVEFGENTAHIQTYLVPEFNDAGEIETILAVSRDLTKIKRVEAELRESQRFNEQVMKTVPNIVYVHDIDAGHNIFINRHISRTLGYTSKQIANMEGDVLENLMHPDDWANRPAQLEHLRQLKDGEIFELEYRMRDVNGGWHWLRSREAPFKRHPDGTVSQVLGTAQDITQNKRYQQALIENRANLLALIENTEDSVWSVDRELNLIIANTGMQNAYRAEFGVDLYPGNSALADLPQAQHDRWMGYYQRALQGEQFREELSFYNRQNEQLHFELSFSPIYSQDKIVTGVTVFSRNVTERTYMAQRLDENQRFINKVVEVAPYGIYVYDLVERKNIYANARNAEFLGLSLDDTSGLTEETIFATVHPDDTTALLEAMNRTINAADGEVVYSEFRMRNTDGSWWWLGIWTVVFKRGPAGAVQQILGISMDITDSKAAQEQAKRYELEQERVNLITNFIRAVSHEFRTPLSSINASSYLIKRTVADHDHAGAVQRYLDRITQEAEQILNLVQALLTMSRLDSGVHMDLQAQFIAPILRDLVNRFNNRQQDQPNINLDLLDESYQINASGEYLDIALTNLLDNALRYTPADNQVYVTLQVNNDCVEIIIRDEGSGISGDAFPNIFDRFYRADQARSTRGFGVGLPIAQKIIERHNGTIDITSTPEVGTVVTVQLPLVKPAD